MRRAAVAISAAAATAPTLSVDQLSSCDAGDGHHAAPALPSLSHHPFDEQSHSVRSVSSALSVSTTISSMYHYTRYTSMLGKSAEPADGNAVPDRAAPNNARAAGSRDSESDSVTVSWHEVSSSVDGRASTLVGNARGSAGPEEADETLQSEPASPDDSAINRGVQLAMLRHLCRESTFVLSEQTNTLAARRHGIGLATARDVLTVALGLLSGVSLIGPAIDLADTDRANARAGDRAQLALLGFITVASIVVATLGYFGDDAIHAMSDQEKLDRTRRADSSQNSALDIYAELDVHQPTDRWYTKLEEAVNAYKAEVQLSSPKTTPMQRIGALRYVILLPVVLVLWPCLFCCRREERRGVEMVMAAVAAPMATAGTTELQSAGRRRAQTRPATYEPDLKGLLLFPNDYV